MSNIWTRAWTSTPKIDCGLCGQGTCAGYARGLLVGWLDISSCPLLDLDDYANMRAELESIKKRSPTPRIAPEIPAGGILLTKPCIDTKDRVMAEIRLVTGVRITEPIYFGVFDALILCDLLECLSEELESVKCSRDLGYGRADIGDMNVTFLQDGRINMRRVLDRESVENLFHSLERVLLGAVVCNSCGKDLLTVMVSGHASDEEGEHMILHGGSGFSIDKQIAEQPLTKAQALQELGDENLGILNAIDQAFSNLKEDLERVKNGEREVSQARSIEPLRCELVKTLYNKKSIGKESALLKVLAYLYVIQNGFHGLTELTQELIHCSIEDRDVAEEIVNHLTEDGIYELRTDGYSSRLIVLYAHAMRVNSVLHLESVW